MIAPFKHFRLSSKTFRCLAASICALALLAVPVEAGAAGSDRPELSLTFPTGEMQLSGSQASVWSTCRGPAARVCSGTLTLASNGSKYEIPFSVVAGTNQSLTVPRGAAKAKRIVAVARTAQANGAYVRSRDVLHVR